MKIILREDVKTKGVAGDIIDVKTGYARNYLIPRGLAYIASDANMRVYDGERVQKVKKIEQMKLEAEKTKAEIEKISLTAVVKVDDEGTLYGSVNAHTVADLLKEKGYEFSHRKITLDDSIKELGVYEAQVELVNDVEATVKVWVVKE